MNDNQFRTQISLQASDVNTRNGFINNYIAPNLSRHNGNWGGGGGGGGLNTTRASGVNLTNEYLDNYQNTNTPTVSFREDVNADFYA